VPPAEQLTQCVSHLAAQRLAVDHKDRRQPEAAMKLRPTVASVINEHVTLELESIDRLYLNIFVPQLQREGGVAAFFRVHRGHPFASSALMDPISKEFVARLESFANEQRVPVVQFRKGERKDDIAAEFIRKFKQEEGVLFIGKAQEKTRVFRTERRRNPKTGVAYPWLVRSTAMVNHYYIYGVDRDFGPFFLKFCTYFPYTAKLYLNGHEWLKQQLRQRGIGFESLDNGLSSCDDIKRAQVIADSLSAEKIDALLRKWLRRLPHPFTPSDRKAGYRYDISILQAEFSLTQVLEGSAVGRVLRGSHWREPRYRAAKPGAIDLWPAHQHAHAWSVPHPRHHGRGHSISARRLQEFTHQTVLEAIEAEQHRGIAYRDHHKQHPRLWYRQASKEPAGASADWFSSQPTHAGG
jgi:hypothetical protein